MFKHRLLVAAVAAAVSGPALATNGYFLPGSGFRAQGMGGVGIAYGRDTLSTAANPANAAKIGMRGDLGAGIFNPERHAAVGRGTGLSGGDSTPGGGSQFDFFGDVESDTRYFIVPEIGVSMPLSEKLSVSFAVVANGGMNTTYRQNFFSFAGNPPADKTLGVDLSQLLIPLTAAYKVNEDHVIGASLVLAETRFRAYGLDAFANFPNLGSNPTFLTNKGYDYSYGAGVKLGWQGEFLDDKVTLGLVYTSRAYMTKFDKYKGLFAQQGDFDIPENFGAGIAFKPMKNLVIAADIVRINYNAINSVGNRGPQDNPGGSGTNGIQALDQADPNRTDFQLGKDQGLGFGWRDQTVYKVGVNYGVNNRLQVRAGFNYGKTPIPNDQLTFNLLAPATVEEHYSVGFTYKANENLEITGTYMYVAPNSQTNCNQNIVDCVTFNMHQNLFALSMGWVLDPGESEYGDDEWAGINFDGWYGGLNIGQSRYRGVDLDTSNTRTEGWKAYAGYEFNKYLAVEGGYVNLNDYEGQRGSVRIDADTDGWFLEAVGSYPITKKLAVTGKVGGAYLLADINTKNGSALTVRTGEDELDLTYGAGVKYALLDNVDARLEWDRYDRDSHNIDLVSAGLAVKF